MVFSESLKKYGDFQRVYRKGKSYANKYLVMYMLKQDTQKNRIGISVSKKVGNSVVRHRMCRQIREIFRLNKHRIQTGLNIILVVRPTAKHSDYHELESAFLHLCGLHNIKLESK